MKDEQSVSPYRPLGRRLKAMRERSSETLAEASGAVEIDVKELASYELGQKRPTEEILLLLISHFGAQEDEAVRLWDLAGYGMDKIPAAHMASALIDASVTDSPVLFTDIVDVIVNKYGVVMNFMQASGSANSKPRVVSRVGMSREHAKSLLKILQVTLAQTERPTQLPKRLNTPEDNQSS